MIDSRSACHPALVMTIYGRALLWHTSCAKRRYINVDTNVDTIDIMHESYQEITVQRLTRRH